MKRCMILMITVIAVVSTSCLSIDPSHETFGFPTGRFLREDGFRTFEFLEDGTWKMFYADASVPSDSEIPDVSGRYGVSGNYFTEMTHDYSGYLQIPVTYTWTFDDDKLTFELWSETDAFASRQACYDGCTYIMVK